MAMLIQAPANTPQSSVTLPNPQLGDTDSQDVVLNVKRAISGVKYTHIKRNSQRVLTFDLLLTRAKAQELQLFVEYYYGEEMRLFDWRDRIWKGIWEAPEFILVPDRINEYTTVAVSFRGQQIV